ncbi:FixH family protein [Alkalibacillus haloalkaliphilus]|uniref:FixH family protein n=1 Tax=Alkalibacillus haloalkaliphilus TaxID=94136 RepID=UPI0002EC548B|nr:FixH family protein [Alkalibacillus haloalkaliphilus]
MNKWLLALVTVMLVTVAACGGQDEETTEEQEVDSLAPLEVEVLMDEQIDTGENMLSTRVTQDGQPVEDASEVMFEVWQEGQKESSDMIEGNHVEDGLYEVSYTFEEEGVFYLVPHVTARDQHHMPQHDLVVGDAEVETATSDGHPHEHDHHSHTEDADERLSVDFQMVNDQLTTEVLFEGQELENADVTFEVWHIDHEDQRAWISANESAPGVYQADFDEDTTGEHHVIIHIENDDLHEHIGEVFEY